MNFKKIIASVAPFLGTLVGGPTLGSAVSKVIGSVLLGRDDASEDEIANAITNATPDQLIKLKEIDAKAQSDFNNSEIERERIAQAGVANARDREIATGDDIPGALALILSLGMIAIFAALFSIPIPKGSEALIDLTLGSYNAAWMLSMAYYFGSSSGSKLKTKIIGVRKV